MAEQENNNQEELQRQREEMDRIFFENLIWAIKEGPKDPITGENSENQGEQEPFYPEVPPGGWNRPYESLTEEEREALKKWNRRNLEALVRAAEKMEKNEERHPKRRVEQDNSDKIDSDNNE